jgi:hypothetical protein
MIDDLGQPRLDFSKGKGFHDHYSSHHGCAVKAARLPLAGRARKCYIVSMKQVRTTIAGQEFVLAGEQVERRLREELPDPLDDHYVVVSGRRFPPKQVISLATGLDRADFNTHQARSILSRLGFTVGRRSRLSEATPRTGAGPHGGEEADILRPFAGKWVAQRGLEVLVAADSPLEVLAWLERHNQQADAMFRVPTGEPEATGAAPA